MTTALITEPLFVAATQILSHPSFSSTQHESVNSTAGLELNQPIDSFDTVALKDLEQVNGGSYVLDQVNKNTTVVMMVPSTHCGGLNASY